MDKRVILYYQVPYHDIVPCETQIKDGHCGCDNHNSKKLKSLIDDNSFSGVEGNRGKFIKKLS